MIVVNLFHLKSTNGIFYYALDYIIGISAQVRNILVRAELADAVRRAVPNLEVIQCSLARYAVEIGQARLRNDLLFTPTSHPMPYFSNQVIVVHDEYPFKADTPLGRLKRRLLRYGLASSKCRVGIINKSEVLPFVRSLEVPEDNILYMPNKLPDIPALISRPETASTYAVGLFGSDSAKKNYGALFSASAHKQAGFRYIIYGHDNAYYRHLIAHYPQLEIALVPSDDNTIADFLAKTDVVASVALLEGFGRPIAAALLAGIPCVLIRRPVFTEFFEPGAIFAEDVDGVVKTLEQLARRAIEPVPVVYSQSRTMGLAWSAAVESLGDMA